MRKLDESSVNETKWDKGREQKRPNEKQKKKKWNRMKGRRWAELTCLYLSALWVKRQGPLSWPLLYQALICIINVQANIPILWLNSSDSL